MDALAGTLVDAQVDLNPHQVEAALFACQNPLAKAVNPANPTVGLLRAGDFPREVRGPALHLVFLKTDLRRGDAPSLTAEEGERVSRALERIAALLVQTAPAQARGKQAAAVCQNRNDGETLKAATMRTLAAEPR